MHQSLLSVLLFTSSLLLSIVNAQVTPAWSSNSTSLCSQPCGGGIYDTTTLTCIDSATNNVLITSNCSSLLSPTCNTQACTATPAVCWGLNVGGNIIPPANVNFTQIDVAYGHVCGVAANGTALCWGNYNEGGAGSVPAHPASYRTVKVLAGTSHACGINTTGFVTCWGDPDAGAQINLTPTSTQFLDLSCGYWATCGITASRSLICWGTGSQVGPIPAGHTWKQISVGHVHTCGITTDGKTFCWGPDYNSATDVPANVNFISINPVRGGSSAVTTCGILDTGVVYCWGDTSQIGSFASGSYMYTQIGNGNLDACALTNQGVVVCQGYNVNGQVSNVPSNTYFSSISVGGLSMCGLKTPQNTPSTTGYWKQVPIGSCSGGGGIGIQTYTIACTDSVTGLALSSSNCSSTVQPYTYTRLCSSLPPASGPVSCWGGSPILSPVSNLDIMQLNGRNSLYCGLTSQQHVTCFGQDPYAIMSAQTQRTDIVQVAVGDTHACVLTTIGSIVCWGAGVGSLGVTPPGYSFTQIAAGEIYMCGITSNQQLVCWTGGVVDTNVPSGYTWSQVSVSKSHSCGVTTSGLGFCWGTNQSGDTVVPVGGTYTSIITANSFGQPTGSCGRWNDSTLHCFGDNTYGSLSPSSGIDTTTLAMGTSFTCALSNGGSASINTPVCWGLNTNNNINNVPHTTQFGSLSSNEAYMCGIIRTSWMVTPNNTCSATCGGGVMTSTVVCVDMRTNATLPDSSCNSIASGGSKPVTSVACNTNACPTTAVPTTQPPTTTAPTTAPSILSALVWQLNFSTSAPVNTVSGSNVVPSVVNTGGAVISFVNDVTRGFVMKRDLSGGDSGSVIALTNSQLTASYTKSIWFNAANAQYVNCMICAATLDSNIHLLDMPNNDGVITASQVNGQPQDAVISSATIVAGTWYHIVVTYDASTTTMKIYRNAALVGTGSSVANFPGTPDACQIGQYASLTSYGLHGRVDLPAVYNRALTSTEVTTIYNTQLIATTAAPTTQAPTTVNTTTAAPTTAAPTNATVNATTAVPTTQAPTTVNATTVVPTTAAPVNATTVTPTTQTPTTINATTSTPTTQAPTTANPTTASVNATTSVPTTQAPTTVNATTSAPTTAVPTNATVNTTTTAPTTTAPTTVNATTAVPTTVAPTTVAVTTAVPTTLAPNTTAHANSTSACSSSTQFLCDAINPALPLYFSITVVGGVIVITGVIGLISYFYGQPIAIAYQALFAPTVSGV